MDARRDDVPNDGGAPREGDVPEVAVKDAVRPPLFARLRPSFTLTPINERRWANFKANRRGYWSFLIFLGLCFVMMFAELLANDRPLIAHYKGETLYPVLVDYPESKFGGFLAVTDYRDPTIIDEIEANGWMLWPPIRYSYDTINKDYPNRADGEGNCTINRDGVQHQGGLGYPAPPQWAAQAKLCDAPPDQLARYNAIGNWNWLGLDNQGRDVLARVIYGFRISVLFGLILTILSSIVGVAAGAVQGYYGGWLDLVMQRFLEIWGNIPTLYVLIIIAAVLVPGFWTLLFVLLAFQWTSLVGVVRAEFLRARNFEYVRAARALGLPDRTIMRKHVLPNAMVAALTFMPFQLSSSITTLTSLDFLGLGLPPGSPSLGELLLQGKGDLGAPWLGMSAFFSIAIMLSLLIFIFEAVRDALDPRKTFA